MTSLNAKVQAVAQQALNSAIARSRAAGNDANQGAAIVETTTGRIVAMASYPDYNPNVWTNGISQQEVDYLFGLGGGPSSGEPAVNWATQGQYAPGSTFKVTSTAAAVADGFPLQRPLRLPGVGEHRRPHVHQRRRAEPGRHVVLRGADPVLRHGVLRHRLPDVPDRRPEGQQRAQRERAHAEDAADGARLGLRQGHRRRPAGGVHRHDPDPPVALQHVGGQRAQGPELVQERQGQRLVRAADRVRRLPERLGMGARPGGDRGDRPGLRDRRPRCSSPTPTSPSPTAARCTRPGSARP